MTDATTKPDSAALDIASYLRRHPEFLANFPDIALALRLPRDNGKTASLASYQLDVLRDKNRELSRRLHELTEIAQENERLTQRVHALTLSLMQATTLSETVTRLVASLTEDFHTELVRLVLFRNDPELPVAEWLQVEPEGAQALPAFTEFFEQGEPLCGRLQKEKLDSLFGARSGEAASTALLPLADQGMLAIASADSNRFHPGMGTVFLKLISAAANTALMRFPHKLW